MKLKSGLPGPFLLLLLFLLSSTELGRGSVVRKQYWYSQSHKTWQDAQSFCRGSNQHHDLAIISTQSDENLITMTHYHAWTGLHRSTTSSSSWTWTNTPSSYINWAQNEPHNSENCATVYYNNRKFYGQNCAGSQFFLCHTHDNHFEYTFVPKSMSWSDARQYCKSHYDDLATFTSGSYMHQAVNQQNFPLWIGLHKNGGTWEWSYGLSEYRNWVSNEPGNNGDCVTITSTEKKMATQDCSAQFPFLCFRDNLVLVKENKTWEEALEHCRALNHELVSVEPGQDHNYMVTRIMEADTEEVWAGLRFLAGHWLWVNAVSLLYSDLPVCPPWGQHCGALSKNNTGSMVTIDCAERRNFLCYN